MSLVCVAFIRYIIRTVK